MRTTERGFKVFAEFRDKYHHETRVQESSAASERCVWIFTESNAAHLTVEMAKQVRDALNEFIDGA